MYGYVTWRMMTEIYVMYGSEGVNNNNMSFYLTPTSYVIFIHL